MMTVKVSVFLDRAGHNGGSQPQDDQIWEIFSSRGMGTKVIAVYLARPTQRPT